MRVVLFLVCLAASLCLYAQAQGVCNQQKETGPCRARLRRYYYEPQSGQCQRFYYGGCLGNDNNFRSLLECREACARTRTLSTDRCSQPKMVGPCRGHLSRFFFNSVTGACEMFGYGGCLGNDNNFRSETECQSACAAAETVATSTDRCSLPKAEGPCRAYHPRYYYDSQTGTCRLFGYGGCLGNENNFRSEQECQQACVHGRILSNNVRDPVCNMPKVTGPCRANFRRYFFNSETETCERFVYGGCRGNENRFNTEADCLARCAS